MKMKLENVKSPESLKRFFKDYTSYALHLTIRQAVEEVGTRMSELQAELDMGYVGMLSICASELNHWARLASAARTELLNREYRNEEEKQS